MNPSCIESTVFSSARLPKVKAKAHGLVPVRRPLMKVTATSKKRIHLQRQELYLHRLEVGEVFTVFVLSGQLWATMENDPTDHVLSAGSRSTFMGPGLLVAEALEAPAVVLTESKVQVQG